MKIEKILLYKVILLTFSVILLLNNCSSIAKHLVYNYTDPWHKKVTKAGFAEKTAHIGPVKLNYAEGPDNGPALLLLHAQHMDWFSYSRVLPELAKSFHVFAVDYHGHGKTICPDEYLTADQIGDNLAFFIESVIKEPAFVTGNSSGGLLTTWLAANKPELVKAIVLEDPPLFSSEYPGVKNTIAYKSFTTCHSFIEKGEDDFLIYWLETNSAFIAKNAGEKALPMLVSVIQNYRKKNPGKAVELKFLDDYMRMFIRGLNYYNPHFGDAFYDGRWNKHFNHAEALQNITCPVLLLHANFEIREDGILNGAMDQEDADRAASLIPDGEYKRIDSAHTVHLDKPEQFLRTIKNFFLDE